MIPPALTARLSACSPSELEAVWHILLIGIDAIERLRRDRFTVEGSSLDYRKGWNAAREHFLRAAALPPVSSDAAQPSARETDSVDCQCSDAPEHAGFCPARCAP